MRLKEKFIKKYQILFKNNFNDFFNGFDLPRSYGLRLNSLKCNNYKNYPYLQSILKPNPLVEGGFYYQDHPGRHPYHHAGVYYIQDPSAMMVIENADIQEGDIVFDMSAAPGGKSTHILSKLNQTGLLIANEIFPKRAKILSENIERMGAHNAIVISCDSQNLNKDFYGYFNKVIVDAPCSGEGMFRKDEQAVLDWSEEKVLSCSILQKSLLDIAYQLVKENGIIIYSTCTFSPEENELVVQHFMKNHKDITLLPTIKSNTISHGLYDCDECSRFYFHQFHGEGHFIAKMKKTSPSESNKFHKSKSLKKASAEDIKLLNEFIKKYLVNFKLKYDIFNFNNHLYSLNYDGDIPNLDKLSIIRYGLHLGEIKTKRFEPSHSLALALKPQQVKYTIDFTSNSQEVIQYLSGETLHYPGNNRFTLITVDGFPLGWAKHVQNTLKNYYPKGLRIKK